VNRVVEPDGDLLATSSDEELASLASREGSDGLSFHALVERFRDRVWRVCWRLMGNRHDAEDAAQEVFVRLFFERAAFAGRSRYSTWLHGVAIRTCLTLRRSRSRRRQRETTEVPDGQPRAEAHAGAEPDPATAVASAQDLERLLTSLDEDDRALILMKFAEGHDYDALAEMFDSTPGALRMRVSRIRERLAGRQ
jgi:RNA polymerase sigma-70 factor (ECF subfamily)